MNKCSNRIGITLAVATITLFAGIQGLRAQDQVSTFADTWLELTALMADPDGLNSPNSGFAYDLPVNVVSAIEQTYVWPELSALLADPDGLNSPNTGFAYEVPVVPTQRNSDVIAERQGATK